MLGSKQYLPSTCLEMLVANSGSGLQRLSRMLCRAEEYKDKKEKKKFLKAESKKAPKRQGQC